MDSHHTMITGASAGIGKDCALNFARQSHTLYLGARRRDRLEHLRLQCLDLGAPEVHIDQLDVRDLEQCQNFCARMITLSRERISILINNAGLAKGRDPLASADIDHWRQMIDTNIYGLLFISKQMISHFLKINRGHIVNVGSLAGLQVYEGGSVYCATKYAVHAISDALRLEVNGTGIRVSEMMPGLVETEFSKVRLDSDQAAQAVYHGLIPLTGADVADAISYIVNAPAHVCVAQMVLLPTDQASSTKSFRRT